MKLLPHFLLAKRLMDAALGRARLPYKLNWIITKSCHSKCVHCHIWKVKPQNELTIEEIECFNQKNPYFSWVNFTGGEPTDREDLSDIIGLFIKYQKGLRLVHFPTNGLKPDHVISEVKKILAHEPSSLYVTVSIDGPEKINDRLRGIEGDFRLAIETLQKLKEIPQVKSFVGMTLYPYNVHTVEQTYLDIKKEVKDFDYGSFHVNLPHVSEHYYENQVIKIKAKEALLKAVEDYKEKRKDRISSLHIMEHTFQKLAISYLKTGKTPVDCAALLASCFMNEHGMIFPCSVWAKPIGSIRDHDYDLKQILSQDKIIPLRQQILDKNCANCWTPCEAFQSILANPFSATFGKK